MYKTRRASVKVIGTNSNCISLLRTGFFGKKCALRSEKSKTKPNPKTGRPVSYKMRREYEVTFKYLKDYAAEKKIVIDFKDFTGFGGNLQHDSTSAKSLK